MQQQKIFKVHKLAENITQIRHKHRHVSLKAHISLILQITTFTNFKQQQTAPANLTVILLGEGCVKYARSNHKLHTSMSNASATYELYAFIGIHSYCYKQNKQELSSGTQTIVHGNVLPGACSFKNGASEN